MNGGRRVAVTGLGVVAPTGIGRESFWNGLLGPGASGGQSLVIDDWDPAPYFDNPKQSRRTDRVEQFAVAAAAEAFEQAGGIGAIGVEASRFGTIFATGVGGLHSIEEQVEIRLEKGARRVSPFLVPMMMANASGASISMRYGLQGPNETICTACAAGSHAIAYAARLIRWGVVDAVATGGSEAAATRHGAGRVRQHDGTLHRRRESTLRRRPRWIRPRRGRRRCSYWRSGRTPSIVGPRFSARSSAAASTADAHHITAPSPGGVGAIACMRLALAESGIEPGDVKQVNAHGTSTPLNDAAEAAAITAVFGPRKVPVVSTKGVTGHALGAAGALEAAATLLSIEHRLIPPTANTKVISEDMDIDLVIGEARPWEPGPVISNNFGFGGHNGSVVIAPAT